MMERWLTTADVQRILGYRDPRAARERIKELGGRKIGGEYRLPPDALDALLPGPERINERPTPDQRLSSGLRPAHRAARDPRPPASLDPGWWKQEQT